MTMSRNSRPTRRDLLLGAGAAGLALAALPAAADEEKKIETRLPVVKPAEIGLDPRRLQGAYDLMEKMTAEANGIPGGAILVGRNGKTVAPRFFGRQTPLRYGPAIREDPLFLMASITKPIVYLAALMLVERGRLNLTDRVTRYVPEFAAHDKEETLVLHLFTHTSGLPDMLPNNEQMRRDHASLAKFLDGASRDTELLFKPGTKLSYQSMGTAVVADIVQRLSGKRIAEFLRTEIFEPLNLKSIGLGSKDLARERIVRVEVPEYQNGPDWDWNSLYWHELGVPWGGLFSSAEDFAVLCQVMLSGGAWGGVRLLSPATVRMMTTNRLDDLPDLPEPVRRTQPWGLGWRMNHTGTPDSWGDLLGRHVFGHTGASGTMVWMDPQTQGFCILLTSGLRAKAPWRLVHLSNAVAASFV
jgi:CubicO group peptidase (beta-lactamase class C family)